MNIEEPIVILQFPRSGSSMVAGLFAGHGVWTGEYTRGNQKNPKGFFENLQIKSLLIKEMGSGVTDAKSHKPIRKHIENILKSEGYEGGPWLMKHSANFWRAWEEFKPKWVLVRRNLSGVYESCSNTSMAGINGEILENAIMFNHNQMDRVRDQFGGYDVFTDDLIKGDYSSLQTAIEGCGLEFNESFVKDFIDPEAWHYA